MVVVCMRQSESLQWAAVLKACRLHKAALSPAGGRRQQRAPSRLVDPVSLIRRDLGSRELVLVLGRMMMVESTTKMVRGEIMRLHVPMEKFNEYFLDPANIEMLVAE